MTCSMEQSMGRNPHLLSDRLSGFLRSRRSTAKGLARDIGCDPRTAENFLAGHWPNARHWLGIVAAFGPDVVEAVFDPQTAVERLEKEADRLARELAETRARAQQMARLAPGAASAVAPDPAGGRTRRAP